MLDQDTAKAAKQASARPAPARSVAATSADPTGILTLQRGIGNAAVTRLLGGSRGSAPAKTGAPARKPAAAKTSAAKTTAAKPATANSAAVKDRITRTGQAADFLAGGVTPGGNTPGGYGQSNGIGAAGILSGVLAVPDMVSSVVEVCEAFTAYRRSSPEQHAEAKRRLLETLSDVVANTSAVAGGVTSGAGNISTVAAGSAHALGHAGGGLGILTGLITFIRKSVQAHRSDKQTKALKAADFPAKDFKALHQHFLRLQGALEKNQELAVKGMYDHFMVELDQARQAPEAARKVQIAALKGRYEERLQACMTRYAEAKATVQSTTEEVAEAAGLQAAREYGIGKGNRQTVRAILTALSGVLGIPAGALSIAAIALGLSAGAIPIAGWAIVAVIGLISIGLLSWQLISKVRANLQHLKSDPAFRDRSKWDIFFEAMKVWKPKVGGARDKAAHALFDGLTSKSAENKAGAESLVKALRLDPGQLLGMSDQQKAVEIIKARLASA